MIRPRAGDFQYTADEFELMKAQMDDLRDLADGFVFGVLNEDQTADITRTAELVQRARSKPCTFHRAFDQVVDQSKALEDVIESGCRAILSSGGAVDAVAGRDALRMLVQKARGRIVIIPGGGVRGENLAELRLTGADVFHSSALARSGDLPDVAMISQMRRLLSILEEA